MSLICKTLRRILCLLGLHGSVTHNVQLSVHGGLYVEFHCLDCGKGWARDRVMGGKG